MEGTYGTEGATGGAADQPVESPPPEGSESAGQGVADWNTDQPSTAEGANEAEAEAAAALADTTLWNAEAGGDPIETAVTGGGDGLEDLYNMASGPPKIEAETIPAPEIEVPPLPGQDKLPDLPGHEPSVPPAVLGAGDQQAHEAGRKAPEPTGGSDRPVGDEALAPGSGARDRPEPYLSQGERTERAAVDRPRDGVGFGFGESQPAEGELDRWYNGLSPEQKRAVWSDDTKITITATASRPGSDSANQTLSEQRADAVAQALVSDYGIDSSRIVKEPLGEQPAKDEGRPEDRDDRRDRVAVISIEREADVTAAGRAGADAGDAARLPEAPERYGVGDGLRDSAIDFVVNLVSEAVGAAKTAIDMTVNVFGAIGEAHDKNREASIARGAEFTVSVLAFDARNPTDRHIARGDPYTVNDLERRVRDSPMGREFLRDATYRVLNRDAEKQLRQGVETVARSLNPVLAKARTAAERGQVLRAFVDAASRRISDAHRRR